MLTNLSGTTITFTTCFPARNGCVFGSASASFSSSSCGAPKRHRDSAAHFSVHLQHHFGGVLFGQLLVISRPRLPEHRARAAQLLPQFFGHVRRKRTQQQHQRGST